MLRFSDQIHTAYLDAVRSGSLAEAEAIIACLANFNASGEDHDEAWAALLSAYRIGPRRQWATAVLEAMRVDLVVALAAMPALPPVIGQEDIAQALVTETLAAALDGPTTPARWTRNRLITRATTAVERWLADEIRRLSAAGDPTDPIDHDDGEAARSLGELLVDIEAGRLPARAVVLLYRKEVLGESMRDLAIEAGITINALRMRRERAVDAIRRRLAA